MNNKSDKRNDNNGRNYHGSKNRQNNTNKNKKDINARNEKGKYSDDEIDRARWLDSKAKFIVRDRINNANIDTTNKWIGISNLEVIDKWDKNNKYDPEILSFDATIYDRKVQPKYEKGMTEDEKHQLTYDVAENDIANQEYDDAIHHKKVNRPSFHVDVESKRTKDNKTEYDIKNIKRKK